MRRACVFCKSAVETKVFILIYIQIADDDLLGRDGTVIFCSFSNNRWQVISFFSAVCKASIINWNIGIGYYGLLVQWNRRHYD